MERFPEPVSGDMEDRESCDRARMSSVSGDGESFAKPDNHVSSQSLALLFATCNKNRVHFLCGTEIIVNIIHAALFLDAFKKA